MFSDTCSADEANKSLDYLVATIWTMALAAVCTVPFAQMFGWKFALLVFFLFISACTHLVRLVAWVSTGGEGFYGAYYSIQGLSLIYVILLSGISSLCISWLPAYLLWGWSL